MTIGMHYMSNRTSILIGGVIKTVATMIAAFSTDVRLLFFSIGIVDGRLTRKLGLHFRCSTVRIVFDFLVPTA